MTEKRNIEIFSADCPVCQSTIELVNKLACPSCEVTVLDMNLPDVAKKAEHLGVESVPAVAINGQLASCCSGRGPNEAELRQAGIGQPL